MQYYQWRKAKNPTYDAAISDVCQI